nr:MAG TPA_asm: hypothetical protein [Caudoviricetes sp.]
MYNSNLCYCCVFKILGNPDMGCLFLYICFESICEVCYVSII